MENKLCVQSLISRQFRFKFRELRLGIQTNIARYLPGQLFNGTVILKPIFASIKTVLDQVSPKSAVSSHPSPRSGHSSGFGSRPHSANSGDQSIAANVPMKKITRKSRLVSIYDGRPVSDYTEKVHFEPADDQYEFSSRPNRYF
jgi:hypothetical protein